MLMLHLLNSHLVMVHCIRAWELPLVPRAYLSSGSKSSYILKLVELVVVRLPDRRESLLSLAENLGELSMSLPGLNVLAQHLVPNLGLLLARGRQVEHAAGAEADGESKVDASPVEGVGHHVRAQHLGALAAVLAVGEAALVEDEVAALPALDAAALLDQEALGVALHGHNLVVARAPASPAEQHGRLETVGGVLGAGQKPK